MIELLQTLIVLVAITQVVGLGVALYSRFRPKELEPIVLRGVAADKAVLIVGAFVTSISDDRFGFPTGHFKVNENETTSERLVTDEINFKGSTGFGLAIFVVTWPFRLLARGCSPLNLFLFLCLLGAALYLAVPLLMIALAEMILRTFMKSRIEAELRPLGGEPGTTVHILLRGISALSVERRLAAAFRTPEVPARYRAGPAATSASVAPSDSA